MNQLEKGEALARRAVELRRQILGEGNSKTINAIVILATIHVQQGRLSILTKLWARHWVATSCWNEVVKAALPCPAENNAKNP